MEQKIQRVNARQVKALHGARVIARQKMRETLAHPRLGEVARDPGQERGVARHNADIDLVALIAAARVGQGFQAHRHACRGRVGLNCGGGYGVGHSRLRRARGRVGCRRQGEIQGLAIQLQAQGHGVFGQQEGKQANHRHGFGTGPGEPGQTRRGGEGETDHLLKEYRHAAGRRMLDGYFHVDFAARGAPIAPAVVGFDTQNFYAGLGQRRQIARLQGARRALDHGVREEPRFARRIASDHGPDLTRPVAVGPGGADLVARRRAAPARAGYADAIPVELLKAHPGEIADHVRQHIGRGIADLVEHLLAHTAHADGPARGRGLADHDVAVGGDFRHRIARLRETLGHLLPIRKVAARRLRAALQNMPGETALGEARIVVGGPAESVHAGAQGDGAVHAAADNHDIGAGIQRPGNRRGADIGVDAGQLLHGRESLAREHLAPLRKLAGALHQIIPLDHGHAQGQPLGLNPAAQGLGTGQRIHAPRIADHADPALGQGLQIRRHGGADKIRGVAFAGVGRARARHNGHGDFGQIVVDEEIEPRVAQKLRSGQRGVAPESRGAADADGWGVGHGDSLCCAGRGSIVCTAQYFSSSAQ